MRIRFITGLGFFSFFYSSLVSLFYFNFVSIFVVVSFTHPILLCIDMCNPLNSKSMKFENSFSPNKNQNKEQNLISIRIQNWHITSNW